MMQEIEEAARLWNKTKDPKYKEEWYKLIKEFANGPHNIKRWVVSTNTSNEGNNGRYRVIKQPKLF